MNENGKLIKTFPTTKKRKNSLENWRLNTEYPRYSVNLINNQRVSLTKI